MRAQSPNFVTNDYLTWEAAGEGVKRQIMGYDGQLMMVKVAFAAGAIGYEHAHYHTQATYVASGRFEVTINGLKKTLSAGEGFYTEPNVVHGVVCLEEGVLIDTFSPIRAEFLGK